MLFNQNPSSCLFFGGLVNLCVCVCVRETERNEKAVFISKLGVNFSTILTYFYSTLYNL